MSKKPILVVFLLSFLIITQAGVYAQSAQEDGKGNNDTKPTQIPGRFNKFDPRLQKEKTGAPPLATDEAQTPASNPLEKRKQTIISKLDMLAFFLTKFQTKVTENTKIDEEIRTWLLARITARQAWVDTQKNALTLVETENTLKPMVQTMMQMWQSHRSLGLLYGEGLRFHQFSNILSRLHIYEDLLSQKNADTVTLKEYITSAQNYYDEAKATLLKVNEETVGEGYRVQSHDQLKQGYAQLRLAIEEAKRIRDDMKSAQSEPTITAELLPTHEQ